MRLVHDAEDDLLVVLVPPSELIPECLKLSCGSGIRVASVANDGSGSWLLGRIVIPHIVMRIEYAVGALLGDSFYCVVEVAEVRLVETSAQTVLHWDHTLHQERNAEGVDLMIDQQRSCYDYIEGSHDFDQPKWAEYSG